MFTGLQAFQDPRLLAALANQQQQQDQAVGNDAFSMPAPASPVDLPQQQSSGYAYNGGLPPQADAPDPRLLQRMGATNVEGDLNAAHNQEWLTSNDPYQRRIAWGQTAGPNIPYPGDPLPEEQKAQAMRAGGPTQHHGGFLSRLKDAAIMAAAAGPLGFAAGLISPQLAHNLRYRQLDLPMAEHQAQMARQQADQQAQQAGAYASMSGTNPYTGQPTVMGNYRNYMIGAGNRRLNQADTRLGQGERRLDISQETNEIRKTRLAQQYGHWKDEDFLRAYNSGAMNGNPDALRAFADRLGIPGEVPDRFLAGAVKQTIDSSGTYGTQNLQTGATTSTGVKSYETTKEQGRNSRFQQGEAGKDARHNDSEAQTNRRFVEGEKGKNARAKASRKSASTWGEEGGDQSSKEQAFQQQLQRAQQSPGWAQMSPEQQQQFTERLRQRYQ